MLDHHSTRIERQPVFDVVRGFTFQRIYLTIHAHDSLSSPWRPHSPSEIPGSQHLLVLKSSSSTRLAKTQYYICPESSLTVIFRKVRCPIAVRYQRGNHSSVMLLGLRHFQGCGESKRKTLFCLTRATMFFIPERSQVVL
jgi:hypothetical protein